MNEMLLNLSMEYVERPEKLSRFHQTAEENKRNKQYKGNFQSGIQKDRLNAGLQFSSYFSLCIHRKTISLGFLVSKRRLSL